MATYQILQPGSPTPTYSISDDTYTKIILLNGAELPGIERELVEHPLLEGALDNGWHFRPRTMNLKLFFKVSSKGLADLRRDAIYRIFQPFTNDTSLTLRVTRDDGKTRQIACHVEGLVDLPESNRVGYDQAFDIQLLAPNPIWEDSSTFAITGTPTFNGQQFFFNCLGDWEVWPIIKIYGLVTGYSIINTLTLPGGGTRDYRLGIFTIPAGDIWTWDTRPGYKTLVNSAGVSMVSKIFSPDYFKGFFEFRLWGKPEAAGGGTAGNNLISFFYSTKDGNHKTQATFNPRYLGL